MDSPGRGPAPRAPVLGGGGSLGPAGHGFVHQVVEPPSIPGAVPDPEASPLERGRSTGLSSGFSKVPVLQRSDSRLSKAMLAADLPRDKAPQLERSGTGLSSKFSKPPLERSGTGLSSLKSKVPYLERSGTGLSKVSKASSAKKARFLEDPETENISTEDSEESDSEKSSSDGPKPPAPPKKVAPVTHAADRSQGEPSDLMKLALLQQYKVEFLERVRLQRREVSVPAATGILREVAFFKEFDDVLSGTIFHLAKLALLQDAEEGEVLFRQGDDPKDCYVVTRGSVGVYIRKEEQRSPREFDEEHLQVTLVKKAPRCQLPCFRRQEDEFQLEFVDTDRRYTLEGLNTYCDSSDLGTRVVSLQRGAAFGELGLMERKPRAASIRCESKCTFLVIRRNAFQKWFSESISADVYRKRLFFISKIPGFANETLRNQKWQPSMSNISDSSSPQGAGRSADDHAVDLFKELEFDEGQVILKEGVVEDPVIYIVRSGHLDILRRSMRPHSAGAGQSQARKQLHRPASAGRPRPFMAPREVQFGRLGNHAIFCSLSTLGLKYPEEFSLKVSSKVCSVFVAREDDLEALPERVMKPLLAHIRQALRPLLCYSGAYQCLDQLILEDTKEDSEHAALL